MSARSFEKTKSTRSSASISVYTQSSRDTSTVLNESKASTSSQHQESSIQNSSSIIETADEEIDEKAITFKVDENSIEAAENSLLAVIEEIKYKIGF